MLPLKFFNSEKYFYESTFYSSTHIRAFFMYAHTAVDENFLNTQSWAVNILERY